MGPLHFKWDRIEEEKGRHILAHRVEEEVERFRAAVKMARLELEELRQRHGTTMKEGDLQILDVHSAYLQDPSFLESVERIIRKELLRGESAVARVVAEFERVMDLVEDQALKERAEDLRDVGLRVLRWMKVEEIEGGQAPPEPTEPYVLAARRLSVSDMFSLDRKLVLGILAEEGSGTSHAAILARSMRIPTLTGVEDLFERAGEGDLVILDASEGVVRVNPDERVLREFEEAASSLSPAEAGISGADCRTRDGEPVVVVGSCGTLADVDRCAELGLGGIGVYRTELLFVAEEHPSEEMAFHHYREVLKRAGGAPVTFRLLNAEIRCLENGVEERNPSLGLRAVRALFHKPELLGLQLRALLRAAAGDSLNILVPFVTTREDLRRVRQALEEERETLAREGKGLPSKVHVGICVDVPATALALSDFLGEVDFVVVGLDDLTQYLLAADRDSLAVRPWFQACHPGLFRLLAGLYQAARERNVPIGLFGENAADQVSLPFYLGVGYRSFSISPVRVPSFLRALSSLETGRCRDLASKALTLGSAEEIRALLASPA